MKIQFSLSAIEAEFIRAPRKLSEADAAGIGKKLIPLFDKPEENFWKIIKTIGWGTVHTDYKAVRKILHNVDTKKVRTFNVLCQYKVSAANKALSKADPENLMWELGEDGTQDALAHVLGLGETAYNAFLKNPLKFKIIADVEAESFMYCSLGD